MPKQYKPFEVMKQTDSRHRLSSPGAQILFGSVGPPHESMDQNGRIAWLDLIVAAPFGRLERHHRKHVELTSRLLSSVRRADASKGMVKLLGKCLRDMGLKPGTEPTTAETLDAFEGAGLVN